MRISDWSSDVCSSDLQFRIEALPGQPGLPTPEGMHHDGRDWVLILLVGGSDYAGGESRVEDPFGTCILEHRLTRPGEALLLNDRDVRHGTTPIESADRKSTRLNSSH